MELPSHREHLRGGGSGIWGEEQGASRGGLSHAGGHTRGWGMVCAAVLSVRHKERYQGPWEGRAFHWLITTGSSDESSLFLEGRCSQAGSPWNAHPLATG